MKVNIILILTLAVMLTACGEPPTENKMQETTNNDTTRTLKSELDEKKAEWAAKATDEKKKIYAEGIAAVENSGVLKTAKQVGDMAPDFELRNATGDMVKLSDYLKKGPVVLTWYRGGWCPYCNLTLHRLQEDLPKFKAAGATLIALTPELPDKSLTTKEKHNLQYEVLSDVGNKTGKEYGIVYKLTPEVADAYQQGFDLHSYNGDTSDELPLAATYVVDQTGKIRYAFLDAEYRERAEPSDVLKVLKDIKQQP